MKITKDTFDRVYRAETCSVETMRLKGYELVSELFVDSSGLGRDDEPALSQHAFRRGVDMLLDDHGTLYATITRAGQFQVYVGLFKKAGKALAKKIAGHTYRLETPEGYTIRYHDTDIVTVTGNTVTLDSGGWYTKTTKERINDALQEAGRSCYISQKAGEWYLVDREKETRVPFSNGMHV